VHCGKGGTKHAMGGWRKGSVLPGRLLNLTRNLNLNPANGFGAED
jgi:hypothetical protein